MPIALTLAHVEMARDVILLLASASVYLASRAIVVNLNAPVAGTVFTVDFPVTVTWAIVPNATPAQVGAFVHQGSKVPGVMSLVMMISMARSVKHNVPYVQDTRSVHVRRCMATARAPLVTKDTFALMTVRWTDMACIARKCVSVR